MLIAWRELVRLARSPRVYVLRVVVAGGIGALLAYSLSGARATSDPAVVSVRARAEFQSMVTLVDLTIAFLAVILTASAVQEERDDDTLELLALTPLRPSRILASKVIVRVALVLAIAGAALPLLAASTSAGGVGTDEVVGAAIATVVIAWVYAGLGAAVGVRAGGVVAPVLSAVLISIPAMVVGPRVYADARYGWRSVGEMTPFYWETWGWSSAWLPGFWTPVVVGCFLLAEAGFRERTGRPAAAMEDRLARLSSAATVLFLVLAPLGISRVSRVLDLRGVAAAVVDVGVIPVFGLGLFGSFLLATQTFARLAELAPSLRFQLGRSYPRGRSFAWLDPVLHRELFTHAYGGAGLVLGGFAAAWGLWAVTLGFMALRFVAGGHAHRAANGFYVIGAPGMILGILAALLLGATAASDEVRRGTLPLWWTTTHPPGRLVRSKLVSVLLRTAPFAVVGAALWWTAGSLVDPEAWSPRLLGFEEIEVRTVLPVVGAGAGWTTIFAAREVLGVAHAASVAFAAAVWGLLAGLRFRGLLTWVATVAPVPVTIGLALSASDGSPLLLLFPWIAADVDRPGVALLIPASTLWYASFGTIALAITAVRVRRWTL